MIGLALIILLALFLLGFLHIPGINITDFKLFVINSHLITLYDVLIVLVVFGLIALLPKILKLVTGALFIIWILATLGFIVVQGLSTIILVTLILIVVGYEVFQWQHRKK